MVKLNSNFLKTEQVQSNDKVKFIDEGGWVETKYKHPDGNPKNDFQIKVLFNGEEKTMRLNKTNRDALIKAFGDETSKWKGKEASIELENVMVNGERKKSIFLTPLGVSQEANNTETKEAWDE